MRTLPFDASDDEIRGLAVEFHELLAQERFADALELLPHDPKQGWTPARLEEVIRGYGVIGSDIDDVDILGAQDDFARALERMPRDPQAASERAGAEHPFHSHAEVTEYSLALHGVDRFQITTLVGRPDAAELIAGIVVDRENAFGLDPALYDGMVLLEEVPLSGFLSDLTALFHIKRVGADRLTLEFHDLHVM